MPLTGSAVVRPVRSEGVHHASPAAGDPFARQPAITTHLEADGLARGRERLKSVQMPLAQQQQVVQLPVVQGQRRQDAAPVRLFLPLSER